MSDYKHSRETEYQDGELFQCLSAEEKMRLRKKACFLLELPESFAFEIEDYRLDGAVFSAIDQGEKQEGYWLELDREGRVLNCSRYSEACLGSTKLSSEERKKSAYQFVLTHYPQALEQFTYEKIEEGAGKLRLMRSQEQVDLPLENSGFFITVLENGKIGEFRYYGEKPVPEVPVNIPSKEQILETYIAGLSLELIIARVDDEYYSGGKRIYELVYDPIFSFPYFYPLTKERGEREVEEGLTYHKLATQVQVIRLSLSDWLDFNEEECIKTVDESDGQERRILYESKTKQRDDSRSLDAFWNNKLAQRVKLTIDEETQQLTNFIHFQKIDAQEPLLSLEECYQIAEGFLHHNYPSAEQYLYYVQESAELEQERAFFRFQLMKEDLPVYLGMMTINVNRTNGKIQAFMGVSYLESELEQMPTEALVSMEAAKKKIIKEMDLELAWDWDYDLEAYQLGYRLLFPNLQGELRFINAIDGTMITTAK